jgi:RNA polymerase sigma-70 factor (ECF subfamily)
VSKADEGARRDGVGPSETEWLRLARDGDKDAFGCLVKAYETPVYNLAYRMLGNGAEAEEAAQEAFLRVYSNLHRYDPKRSFRSWLFSIASHYCIDRLRRRRLTWLSLDEEYVPPGALARSEPGPEGIVSRREHEKWIQRLLSELSPTDRAAITLRYWYDCSYQEIGEVLELTVSAVKSRLHRARRALAEAMEGERGHGMPGTL